MTCWPIVGRRLALARSAKLRLVSRGLLAAALLTLFWRTGGSAGSGLDGRSHHAAGRQSGLG